MRIGNNFSTYNSKPQFGMALKIKSEATLESIIAQKKSILKKYTFTDLDNLGKQLKDYKFWDLNIVEDGITISSKTDNTIYHSPFDFKDYNNEYNSIIVRSAKSGFFKKRPEIVLYLDNYAYAMARDLFSIPFPNIKIQLERAEIIIESLEKHQIYKNEIINKLTQKYGAEN